MVLSKDLQILRVPCNGSSMSLTKVPLINIGSGGIKKDDCNDWEKQLQHLPNVKSFDSVKSFSWTYRKLVGLTKNDVGHEPLNGDYMMYMCLDLRSGFPHNDYLEELANLGRGPWMPTVPLKVYGDPFVFKMRSESRESEEYRPAMYLHMDSGFVDSATSRRPVGAWAFRLLRRLLLCPHRGVWESS